MASAFHRTLRSLRAPTRWEWLVPPSALILMVWGAWMLAAEVSVRVAGPARVEIDGSAVILASEVGGRVRAVQVTVGQQVEQGQELLVLDDTEARLALEQAVAERESLSGRLEVLAERVAAQEQVVASLERARRPARQEAEALREGGRSVAEEAEAEAASARSLSDQGALSDRERARSEARAAELSRTAEALARSAERVGLEAEGQLNSARAELVALDEQRLALGGAYAVARAEVLRLEEQLAEHRVVAPVAGTVAALAEVAQGRFVQAGQELLRILPPAELRAIAGFAPADALGRVAPGQPARLRLDGFPWIAYGAVPATVERVASEATEQGVRVELSLSDAPGLPVQHGMTGVVEVEVEQASPADLLLRAAGRRVSGTGP